MVMLPGLLLRNTNLRDDEEDNSTGDIPRGYSYPGLFWFLVFVDDDVDDDDDDDILASDLLGHTSTNKDDNTTGMSLW